MLELTAISVLSIFVKSRKTSEEGVPVKLTSKDALSASSLLENDVGETINEGEKTLIIASSEIIAHCELDLLIFTLYLLPLSEIFSG